MSQSNTNDSEEISPKHGNGPQRHPGHPVHTFYAENDEFSKLINERIRPHVKRAYSIPDNVLNPELARKLVQDGKDFSRISVHYRRKEELLFPYLQKYGETELPRSMWNDDDEVRQYLALGSSLVAGAVARPSGSNLESAADQLDAAATVAERIIKEENRTLFPLALQKLTPDDWQKIAQDSADYGYALKEEPPIWVSPIDRAEAAVKRAFRDGTLSTNPALHQDPSKVPDSASAASHPQAQTPGTPREPHRQQNGSQHGKSGQDDSQPEPIDLNSHNPHRPKPCLTSGPGIGKHKKGGSQQQASTRGKAASALEANDQASSSTGQFIRLATGSFNTEQLKAMLDAIPMGLVFADANDIVRYVSLNGSQALEHANDCVGIAALEACPPEHRSTVRKVLAELRSGERNEREFILHKGTRNLLVRFIAVRNEEGTYLGTLEAAQDLATLPRATSESPLNVPEQHAQR